MRILATRALPGPAWAELGGVELAAAWPPAEPCPGVEAVVVANERVDAEVLALLPDLRLVANFSVGYDAIDVAACRARGVAVTNTPGVLDAATADLAFGLILAARRRIVEGDGCVRAGRWDCRWSDGPLLGRDVTGATLGIVGLGRIGGALARRAEAFEMRVLHTSRSSGMPLDELLRAADVVSIHAPLTAETNGLISRERLALLRDGATLVNTARGALVDEDALVAELASGRISAGLDVFVHEPHVPERLRGLANVVLTPHLGSATVETRAAMTRIVVDNLLAFARGEPLPTPVL
ncbi:MAG TPA: D-glycerate dehydrogenase [Gaiellaceae bacterium]|nr:D-glycerate dehydrogenase [Gaiellaceae bacterium]